MISDSHVGLAFGRTKVINSKGDTLFEPHFEESGLLNSEQALNFIVKNFNPIQHPLVRRSSYFQQGGFREKYGCFVDIHLWTRIAWFSDALYLAAGSTTCIRQHSAQGQNIVSNMSTDNLAILATYFGKRSLKQLQYRVGYNLCLLRVVKFLEQIEARGDMTSKNFVLMLSKLIKSNIFHMIKALLHRNADQINLEMAVYRRINKQFKKNLIFKIYAKEVSSFFCQLPRRVGKLLMKNFHRKSNRLKTNF